MDRKAYEAAVARLKEVNVVIKSLDETIRSDAFTILCPYVTGRTSQATPTPEADVTPDDPSETVSTASPEAFVRSQDDVHKPVEAAKAIAAWWFSEYGSAPIKAGNIREIADQTGVTIPDRPDATLRGMRAEGKPVYKAAGRGALTPTIPHGELFFQNEYKVKKGKKTPPDTA